MYTTERILRELGSDAIEPSPALFAAAAADGATTDALVTLVNRAASAPQSLTKSEVNRVSWAPYVFAENGGARFVAPLVALGSLKAGPVRRFTGAYADYDLPSIYLRLGGKSVVAAFGPVVQTFEGAPEVRIAPILAAGAAWAHGLIKRDAALTLMLEELTRMSDETYSDAQDDEWLDTVLDAALELHPAGLEDALEELRDIWGMEEDWDAELEAALDETEAEAKARLRDTFPIFTTAVDFVGRWETIDAEE